jgi:thiamine pyrophosphate-dependent acetolactate synthase large subunit-like protein
MGLVGDEIVVSNLGHPSQELYAIEDRPRNFYMLGSMGLASSVGLGLALSTSRKVVVLEGDGSLLTFTAKGTDLAGVAKACSLRDVSTVDGADDLEEAVRRALKSPNGPFYIQARVDRGKPETLHLIPLDSIQLRDRFMGSIHDKET